MSYFYAPNQKYHTSNRIESVADSNCTVHQPLHHRLCIGRNNGTNNPHFNFIRFRNSPVNRQHLNFRNQNRRIQNRRRLQPCFIPYCRNNSILYLQTIPPFMLHPADISHISLYSRQSLLQKQSPNTYSH